MVKLVHGFPTSMDFCFAVLTSDLDKIFCPKTKKKKV